ncbi:MAG: cytochrome c3 family protein, partial [Gammaproteobacteria bacterium]|nr:cytochrome c3 family protein [Gammaproteobacteria bacterium]
GSVSIACLSCHDGTTAMDVMINAPTDPTTGASNYSPSGIRITGSWTGPASATDGQLNYDSIAFIDTDLRNDHPIGIQYAGGGITATNHADNTTFAGVMGDPDFNAPYKATINGNAVWWVDVDADGIRDKTDMQLYTRNDLQYAADGTSLGINEPSVECASCHNPHTSETATFLRMANTGSALCLACHVK